MKTYKKKGKENRCKSYKIKKGRTNKEEEEGFDNVRKKHKKRKPGRATEREKETKREEKKI